MAGGLLLALVGLQLTLGTPTNPGEALLNPGTIPVFESDSGSLINCQDAHDYGQCLAGHDKRGGQLVLLTGNSQLHDINQFKPGQLGAVLTLHRALRREGLDLLAFSSGNLNIQEQAVDYVFLNRQRPIALLLVALSFDDTREDGVREELQPFLTDSGTRATIRKYEVGRQLTPADTTSSTRNEVSASVQSRIEKWLDSKASHASLAWRQRSEIELRFFVWLRLIRNQVFGVTPETMRKRIPGSYANNMAALDMMLAEAAINRTQVILYIAPLRQDVPVPYVREEYDQFKRDVQKAAATYSGTRYADLDTIVPGPLWGEKNSTNLGSKYELDFMHFTSAGHAVLADHLLALIHDTWGNRRAVQQP